jgi:hypothetical protein
MCEQRPYARSDARPDPGDDNTMSAYAGNELGLPKCLHHPGIRLLNCRQARAPGIRDVVWWAVPARDCRYGSNKPGRSAASPDSTPPRQPIHHALRRCYPSSHRACAKVVLQHSHRLAKHFSYFLVLVIL